MLPEAVGITTGVVIRSANAAPSLDILKSPETIVGDFKNSPVPKSNKGIKKSYASPIMGAPKVLPH